MKINTPPFRFLPLNSSQCSPLDEGKGAGVAVYIGHPPRYGAWWRKEESGIWRGEGERWGTHTEVT